ncbi:MAG: AAA family ATPase, partial [Gammaproteobacteria bacterium]|nr:AAA family ATPase [Gammaproteobacteria bacterium]
MTRVVAVTSGKAGVGKTYLSLCLALQCAGEGLRTCLVDADSGVANIASLLGLTPQQTLHDVINGPSRLQDILITRHGVDIIPGSTDSAALAGLTPETWQHLAQEFASLTPYDLIIFDLSENLDVLQAMFTTTPEVILVVTPEPNALTDTYALVKHLQRQHHKGLLRVIVNQAKSDNQA